jgi:hypothetical protein
METLNNIRDLDREILKAEHQIELSQLSAQQSTELIEQKLRHPERYLISWLQERAEEKAQQSGSIVATLIASALRFL